MGIKLIVKAFTIFELLVVLVITSIIIGFGLLVFLQIEKYLNQQLINNPISVNEILFLEEMEKEIMECDIFIGDSNEFKLVSDGGQRITKYIFYEDRIIRFSENLRDSIFISLDIISIVYNDEFPEYIDKVYFDLDIYNHSRNFVLIKKYCPDVLINNDNFN